jgi:hypothetical protein
MSDTLPYTVSFTRVPEWSKMSTYIDSKLSRTAQLQFYKHCEEKWKATPNRKIEMFQVTITFLIQSKSTYTFL